MQIVPSTGRQLARSLGIRRFTTSMLTNPETNIRMGTLYFSRLVQQFGGTYYALASYNAGENRVVRWKAERPGLDEDEFIDDIPFPGDPELRQADSGDGRGLSSAVRQGRRTSPPGSSRCLEAGGGRVATSRQSLSAGGQEVRRLGLKTILLTPELLFVFWQRSQVAAHFGQLTIS